MDNFVGYMVHIKHSQPDFMGVSEYLVPLSGRGKPVAVYGVKPVGVEGDAEFVSIATFHEPRSRSRD